MDANEIQKQIHEYVVENFLFGEDEALTSDVPVRTLTFGRDRSFVPLLERLLDGHGE